MRQREGIDTIAPGHFALERYHSARRTRPGRIAVMCGGSASQVIPFRKIDFSRGEFCTEVIGALTAAAIPGDNTIMRGAHGWTDMRPQDNVPSSLLAFSVLAGCIGILAGLFAVIFRLLIALFHNILFTGKASIAYSETVYTAVSPWGPLVVFVPVVGAVGVAFIAKHFSPQVLRSGIPDVLNVVYYEDGMLARGLAIFRTLASALSIGSGAPVGREGSIFQVGAAIASTAGGLFSLSRERTRVLMAAGGAGGVAATFNTPVGGSSSA